MARPVLEIDPKVVEKLAGIGCTMEEIGSVVGCSVDTLERRFAEDIQRGRGSARASLRRKQFESAMGGNTTMLIWLGKQMLSQSDKVESKTEITGHIESDAERAERVASLLETARGRRDEDVDRVQADDTD